MRLLPLLALFACTTSDDSGSKDSAEGTDADGDGATVEDGDCDDENAAVFPEAAEACDEIDNDCDGVTDESDAIDAATWYADQDGDTYGDAAASTEGCSQPDGYVSDDQDCDDTTTAVSPLATELCDEIDNNCDGEVDEDTAADTTTFYADSDGDTYGDEETTTLACELPDDYVETAGDCDDDDANTNPEALEVCDGADNDCDDEIDETDDGAGDTWYADSDGDDFGNPFVVEVSCEAPEGYVVDDTDCDDTDDAVNPDGSEICNEIDDDCDGDVDEDSASDAETWYADADADGYGNTASTTEACGQPSGFVADKTDCDDTDAAVKPGATETCDGVDNNCDSEVDEDTASDAPTWYADVDGDTYGDPDTSMVSCDQPIGYLADDSDCDDTAAAVHPAAVENCTTGDDDDCSGANECAATPVAPTASEFMWQGVQTAFVDMDGNACEGQLSIALGESALCFAGADGALKCAGSIYTTTYGSSFVDAGKGGVEQILMSPSGSATEQGICVALDDGTVECFGDYNDSGQFGNSSTGAAASWVKFGGRIDFDRIGNGDWDQNCAITTSGTVYCAGEGFGSSPTSQGSASVGFQVNTLGSVELDPSDVWRPCQSRNECSVGSTGLARGTATFGTAGEVVDGVLSFEVAYDGDLAYRTCWLTEVGDVFCAYQENLGFGTASVTEQYFVGSPVLAIAANTYGDNLCAVIHDGSIQCFGSNTGGMLGSGSTVELTSETEVAPPGTLDTRCE